MRGMEVKASSCSRVHGWLRMLRPGAIVSLGASGCSHAPSQSIVGSFFPSWMLCAVAGCAAAVAVRLILGAIRLDQHVFAPPLAYLAVAIATALFLWLFQFGQ